MSGDVIVTVTLNAALHVAYTTDDLAVEDLVSFGQRPKMDRYGD